VATETGESKTSTGLFRKVGNDGLSRLEEVDNPTAVAVPRAKRATGQVDALQDDPNNRPSSPDSAMHQLLDARYDRDRRTDEAAPPAPTAPVPKADPTRPLRKEPQPEPPPSRRGLLLLVLLVILGGGGFAIWKLTQKPAATTVVTANDGGTEIPVGFFVIDPDPDGASVTLTDENGKVYELGKTSHDPKKLIRNKVSANAKFKIHIELPGYNPYDTESTVLPNETLRISPRLEKASAKLHVETNPSGAQVAMGGKLLGETPLNRDGLEPKSGDLVITKQGYETVKIKITLALGKPVDIKRDLKELDKMGTVMIEVTGSASYAEAFFKGKNLGRTRTMQGPQAFHLPVGSQQIKLVHPTDKKKTKTITVNVTESPQTIKASFD
ncbi:MAG TPA: PEGA domain-containing protein, partial [Kofleriaceae bacterium]|nr:PEGA domain-containing protein [Kofleriaceae bacterium]